MDVSVELPHLLNSGEIPINKRINLAKNAFLSNGVTVLSKNHALGSKEDICLAWLCGVIDENVCFNEAWTALQQCLWSDRLNNSNFLFITQNTRAVLLSMLCKLSTLESLTTAEMQDILGCCVHLLDLPIFISHFSRSLSDYTSLIGSMLRCLCHVKNDCFQHMCQKVSGSLILYAKKFSMNEIFRDYFCGNVLLPLSRILNDEGLCKHYWARKEFLRCTHFTLFPRKKQREEHDLMTSMFFQLLQGEESSNPLDVCLFQELYKALKTLCSSDFLSLLRVLYTACISSCRREPERHCQLFLIVCYLLGFKPIVLDNHPKFSTDVNNFFSHPAIYPAKRNLPYMSVVALLGVVNKENLNINVVVAGQLFVDWLRSFCECVTLEGSTIDDHTFEVLTALSELDPNILDAHTVKVIGPAMLRRSKKSRKTEVRSSSYTLFLLSLLHSSVKLHRIQKLASRLLSSAKEELNLDPSLGNKLTVDDIFPKEFCTDFRQSMQLLVGTQALAMLRTLVFHLLEDCVVPMENSRCDPSVTLLLQLTKCLLQEFMMGYKVLDPNIPLPQIEKFTSAMAELGGILGRLGRALLLERHNPDTMGAFLELCCCWGNLHLLLIFYQPDTPTSEQFSSSGFPKLSLVASQKFCGSSGANTVSVATDFSYLHPHLTEGEWSHLVERIVNFGDDACKEMLDELVIQKLRALTLFEPSVQSDKARACALHLLMRARDSQNTLALLMKNKAIIVPLLDVRCLKQLLELAASSEAALGSESHLKALQSNPAIVPVAALSLLEQMWENVFYKEGGGKKSSKRKLSECEETLLCNGELASATKRRRQCTKSVSLIHDLLQLVAKTLTEVVEVQGESSLDGKLLLERSELAKKLPVVIAAKLGGYLESIAETSYPDEHPAVDVSVLNHLLRMLNSLPLSHLTDNLRIVLSLCLIGLLFVSRKLSRLPEWVQAEVLTTKALLHAIKSFNVFRELVHHLNIGSFLAWYISGNGNELCNQCGSEMLRELSNLQEILMERMVELAVSRTAGLNQLKATTKAIKARLKDGSADVDHIYHLSSLLMVAFSKKCGKSSTEKPVVKQFCHKYHSSLAACLIRRVDFSPSGMNKQRLVCFSLALQWFISVKDQKSLNIVGTHLGGLLEVVEERLVRNSHDTTEISNGCGFETSATQSADFDSCCIEFVEKLLSFRVQLRSSLPPMFAWTMWQLLFSASSGDLNDNKSYSKAVKTLLTSADKKEFALLTRDLFDKTVGALKTKSVDPMRLRRCMGLWGLLSQVALSKGMVKIRQSSLKALTPVLLTLVRRWGDCRGSMVPGTSVAQLAAPVLEFERVLLKSRKVSINHCTIDLVLESISAVPMGDLSAFAVAPSETSLPGLRQCLLEFQQVFLCCSNALLALVMHQPMNLTDRIPSFLQQLLKLFQAVILHGNVEYNPAGGLQGGRLSENLLILTDCAISIEWICNALVKYKKDFARVSPYFIADMVSSFEKNIIHPNIKAHLHNCMNVFIYLCDSSGLVYLQRALPAGSREIFKTIFENYKKYYKFKGKI